MLYCTVLMSNLILSKLSVYLLKILILDKKTIWSEEDLKNSMIVCRGAVLQLGKSFKPSYVYLCLVFLCNKYYFYSHTHKIAYLVSVIVCH